jgi:hypothetical protein
MDIARRSLVSLREIWPLETDFSNWLVSEDGIAMIAEDIGINIEDARRECRPGDFPCDVVARIQGDEEHTVVIENQYNKTNHDHLGKLITYASVNNATTAIWISETISDDHRKAIDWLNENTPLHVNFYLAQLQGYRIGNSPVAPQLAVVCRPNVEVKVQREKQSAELSGSHAWHSVFWEDVLSFIRKQTPPFNVRNTSSDSWIGFGLGRSGFVLALSVTDKCSRICCQIAIDAPWRLSAFAQLSAQKEQIEQEVGHQLEWLALPEKRISRIKLFGEINPSDDTNREQVKQWMSEKSIAFHHAFSLRIKNLLANELDSPYEYGDSVEE